MRKVYSDKIWNKLKEGCLSVSGNRLKLEDWSDLLEEDEDFADKFNRLFDNPEVSEADDDFNPDVHDSYLNMELTIDRGGEHPEFAKVIKRLKDHYGNTIGTANDNPILDTRMYEVEYIAYHKQAFRLI